MLYDIESTKEEIIRVQNELKSVQVKKKEAKRSFDEGLLDDETLKEVQYSLRISIIKLLGQISDLRSIQATLEAEAVIARTEESLEEQNIDQMDDVKKTFPLCQTPSTMQRQILQQAMTRKGRRKERRRKGFTSRASFRKT